MKYAFSAHRTALGTLAAAVVGLSLVSAAAPASAATFNVGPETVVRHLVDVRLQNGSGEPLYLGYAITYHWFGLPYAVSRGSYVLHVKDKPVQYELEEARLVEWQAQGHVPSPLPVYRMSMADYILGNLLWIVAGLLGVWYGGKALLFRRPVKAAAPVDQEAAKGAAAVMAQRAALVSRVVQVQHSQKAAPEPVAPEATSAPSPRDGVRSARSASPPAATPVAHGAVSECSPRPQAQERPQVQPQIETLKQPAPRPMTHQVAAQQASLPSQPVVTAMRLPVARTLCRVKALKVA